MRNRDLIRVREDPLDAAEIHRHLEDPGAGGRVVFSGHVRPTEGGKTIAGLHYEQYAGMAEQQMARLAEELAGRWPLLRIALVHRVGFVPVGEASVFVGVASAHRAEAFAAAQHAMARLKEIVPIWKGTESTETG